MTTTRPRARHVLITGACGGIGRALVRAFARPGTTVGIHWAHNASSATQTAAMATRRGARAYRVQADLATSDGTNAVIAAVGKQRRPPDVLVLNAGNAHEGPLATCTEAMWDDVLGVHYRANVLLVGALAPRMRPGSHVVAIGSLVGLRGGPGLCLYAAAKGALMGFVRDAAVRLGQRGVCINAVLPGILLTAMTRVVSAERFAAMTAENALGRPTTTDEVARAVALIATLRDVSGQAFALDSRLHPDGRHSSLIRQ